MNQNVMIKQSLDVSLLDIMQRRYSISLSHSCDKSDILVLDGNFKIHRRICGQKNVDDIYQGVLGKIVKECGQTPIPNSKYCRKHSVNQNTISSPLLDPTSHYNLNTEFFAVDLEESDTSCKNELPDTTFHTRGILIACCPCGHIIFWTEIYKSESISQVYAFLLHLWRKYHPVTTIVYDDSCHLKKYAINKKRLLQQVPETIAISKAIFGNISNDYFSHFPL